MATRFYPTQALPDFLVHGPYRGNFGTMGFNGAGFSPVHDSYRLKTSKTDGGELNNVTFRTNQQANYDGVIIRWFSDRLDAQSISGTFQMCHQLCQQWNTGAGGANSSVVHMKFHIFITQGDTNLVRATLLNNYVESTNVVPFNLNIGTRTGISLNGPPAISTQSALAGDRICIEMMLRVVSSPTPAPPYPPIAFTEISWRGWGTTDNTNTPYGTDLVAGDTVTNRAPWFEFSANLTFQAAPARPSNDSCATAIDFTGSIPFIVSGLNTISSADVNKAVWYKFTAPTTGKFCILFSGTTYRLNVEIWTGTCGSLVFVPSERKAIFYSKHRCQTTVMWDAVAGTEYIIQCENSASLFQTAPNSGGIFGMKAFYRVTVPKQGDLYLPSANIVAFRDGEPVNFSSALATSAPTGVAIDYTKASMSDLNGGFNTNERLLVGLHNFELVEILNLPDLSYGEGQFEVDFIGDPWSAGIDSHTAQLYVSPTGLLIAAWFGNGYLYVSGSGSLPAFLNTVSNAASNSNLKSILAKNGDSQPGAPFADTEYNQTNQITSAWAMDVKNGIVYYTSGSLYIPVGGDEVRRFNTNTSSQGALFVKPALIGTVNPGLRGLAILPNDGILLCNGTVVQKYDSSAVLTGTFTPSISEDSTTLVDVALDPDGIHAFVLDLFSTRVYKFRIADMVEVSTYQTFLNNGSVVQMVVYASPANAFSGIYVLEAGKRNDTLYSSLNPVTTENRKIPDPTYRTAKVGE